MIPFQSTHTPADPALFTVLDKSNYLKGLLILARKDNKLFDSEKNIIRDVARNFGFSRDFYEDTLKSLLDNKYILEEPIRFSNQRIAEYFLTDGLRLAYADDNCDDKELQWLKVVARANDMGEQEVNELIARYRVSRDK